MRTAADTAWRAFVVALVLFLVVRLTSMFLGVM